MSGADVFTQRRSVYKIVVRSWGSAHASNFGHDLDFTTKHHYIIASTPVIAAASSWEQRYTFERELRIRLRPRLSGLLLDWLLRMLGRGLRCELALLHYRIRLPVRRWPWLASKSHCC